MSNQLKDPGNNQVIGFMVVRKPHFNRDVDGSASFSSKVPRLGDIYYGGRDRMPWFELSWAYYDGKLPEDIRTSYRAITHTDTYSSTEVSLDLEEAIRLLHYSNRLRPENELIVVCSEKLSKIIEPVKFDRANAEWLGFDTVALAEWSLIWEGIFGHPSGFPDWEEQLNENGLFPTKEQALDFGAVYLETSHRDGFKAEPLGEDLFELGFGIDAMEVGRVIF